MIITEGFTGSAVENDRLPPGQYLTNDFPILTIGLTPEISTKEWSLKLTGMGVEKSFNWEELHTLKQTDMSTDIHCVTNWSKFDTNWSGVSFDTLFTVIEAPELATHIMAKSADGYSSNIPIEELVEGRALIATLYEGEQIDAIHGGPVRLVIPQLYFWKSAKWLVEMEFMDSDIPGFWETHGYHNDGNPWLEQRYED